MNFLFEKKLKNIFKCIISGYEQFWWILPMVSLQKEAGIEKLYSFYCSIILYQSQFNNYDLQFIMVQECKFTIILNW